MRYPDCNKFASMEMGDPEADSVDFDGEGTISANVRIHRDCTDCGTELKEASFDAEITLDEGQLAWVKEHSGEGHSIDCEEMGCEATERTTGSNRGLESFYGFSLVVQLTCSCKGDPSPEITLEDDVQASHMDEMA